MCLHFLGTGSYSHDLAISEGSGTSRVTTGANPLLGFLGALFWVSVAALIGRWLVVGSPKPFADKLSPFGRARARGAMRSALTYAGLSAAAGSLIIFVWAFFNDIKNGLTAFLWLLPLGGMIITDDPALRHCGAQPSAGRGPKEFAEGGHPPEAQQSVDRIHGSSLAAQALPPQTSSTGDPNHACASVLVSA